MRVISKSLYLLYILSYNNKKLANKLSFIDSLLTVAFISLPLYAEVKRLSSDKISNSRSAFIDYHILTGVKNNLSFHSQTSTKQFELIKEILTFTVEYTNTDNIETIKSKSEISVKIIPKRERFLSEDNKHPSYQVLNLQNMTLHDDYVNLHSSLINKTSRCEPKYLSNISSGFIIEIKDEKITNLPKAESLSKSRKSTDMKSYFKSIDEVSCDSFEIAIEDNDLIIKEEFSKEELSNDKEKEKENKSFNIEAIINKKDNLKKLLN